jgi:hypothetical protein
MCYKEAQKRMIDLNLTLIILSTAFNGILAGARLDQSVKQLPVRHKIGSKAFSIYSQASDLGNGRIWYAIIGIGAALLTILAAINTFFLNVEKPYSFPLYIAAVLSIAHSIVTSKAAPINFQQRKVFDEKNALIRVLDRFEKLQMIRVILQVASFGANACSCGYMGLISKFLNHDNFYFLLFPILKALVLR